MKEINIIFIIDSTYIFDKVTFIKWKHHYHNAVMSFKIKPVFFKSVIKLLSLLFNYKS